MTQFDEFQEADYLAENEEIDFEKAKIHRRIAESVVTELDLKAMAFTLWAVLFFVLLLLAMLFSD